MEGDLLPDVFLHAGIDDGVDEGHAPAFVGIVVAVRIQKFRLEGRFKRVFDISQGKHLPVAVDGKIVLVHLHPAVVFAFDLLNVVGAVGKCAERVVRLSSEAEPEPFVVPFLRGIPCGSALKISVFVRRKPVALQRISFRVIACHLESDARHALLAVAVQLPDSEITSFDPVLNGCFRVFCEIHDLPVLCDGKADGFRAGQGVALRRNHFLDPVTAVGQRTGVCLRDSVFICFQGHRLRAGQDFSPVRIDGQLPVIHNAEDGPLQRGSAQRFSLFRLKIQLADLHAAENERILALHLHGLCQGFQLHLMDLFVRKIPLRSLRLFDIVCLSREKLDDIGRAVLPDDEGPRSRSALLRIPAGLIDPVDSAGDRGGIRLLSLLFHRGDLAQRDLPLLRRLTRLHDCEVIGGDFDVVRTEIQLKARGRLCLFERVASAQDGQHVGGAVFSGRQRPGFFAAFVVQGILRPREAVRRAGRLGIRRCFAHLHLPLFRRLARFHDLGLVGGHLDVVGLRVHLKARGSLRLFERVAPAQDGQHVGDAVFSGRQRPGFFTVFVIQSILRPRETVRRVGRRRV